MNASLILVLCKPSQDLYILAPPQDLGLALPERSDGSGM